jgi:hypothetical protein
MNQIRFGHFQKSKMRTVTAISHVTQYYGKGQKLGKNRYEELRPVVVSAHETLGKVELYCSSDFELRCVVRAVELPLEKTGI